MCWKTKQANPSLSKLSHEEAVILDGKLIKDGPQTLKYIISSLVNKHYLPPPTPLPSRVQGWEVSILIMAEALAPNL